MANSKFPKFKKDKEVETVIGVDLGINTDAVCSVVHKDGTVTGQRFINYPIEKTVCMDYWTLLKSEAEWKS